jgi:hypothetical protein
VTNVMSFLVSCIVFILLHKVLVWKEVLFEVIKVNSLGLRTKNVLMQKKLLELFFSEVRQFVDDYLAFQKLFLSDVTLACEVKSSVCVLGTCIHLVEFMPEAVSDLSVHACLFDAIPKNIKTTIKVTYFL